MTENSVYLAHGIDTGEPLDSEGTFHLRAWPNHRIWASVVVHDCADLGGEPQWMAPYQPFAGICHGCEQSVPEKILAAWFLHNFDAIGAYNGD